MSFAGSSHHGGQAVPAGRPTCRGTMIKFHGLDTYMVEPEPEPSHDRPVKGIIVIIPDAFGIESLNNRNLADAYAAKGGYRVYLPDFMLGHSCPAWFLDTMKSLVSPGNYLMKPYHIMWGLYAFVPWMYHTRFSVTFPTIKAFFAALRRDEGSSLPVGVAGFSWGGKHTLLLTHRDNHLPSREGAPTATATAMLLDAAFIGHPTSVAMPADFEKVTVPTSFAIPRGDHHVKTPRDTEVLRGMMEEGESAAAGTPWGELEVRVYDGCAHGFCTRADFSSAGSIEQQAVDAESQAIAWFNAKLGGAVSCSS